MVLKRLLSSPVMAAAVCCLAVGVWLVSPARAQAYDTWAGNYKFQVKTTTVNVKGKFSTQTRNTSGRAELYIGEHGPTQNGEGYFMKFIDSSGHLRMALLGFAAIGTDQPKSKTENVQVVGAGYFWSDDALGGKQDGVAYIDGTGTTKKDTFGRETSVTLTLKTAGGVDDRFVFSGNPKITLTKQPK